MNTSRTGGWLALSLLIACGDDVASVGDTQSTETDTGSTSGTETETETGESTDTGETDTGVLDMGPEGPYCGDGNLDPEEECDDGNDVDDDGCDTACVSACGADFAVSLNLPNEGDFFAVYGMDIGPDEAITLHGGITSPGVGRLRVATYVDNQLSNDVESDPLGPAGDMNSPLRHDALATAMAPSGDLLVVGTSVDPDADPEQSWWAARYGPDLSEVWRVAAGTDDPDDAPRDIAVLSDGDPVIVRTVRQADNDTDVLVRRLAFADGAEKWASSYSGEFNAGWSLDEGWGVASGAGDALWAMGRLRVDYQTHDTTMVKVDPADGAMSDAWVPLHDSGGNHRQRPIDLAVGPAGEVAVGITIYGPASKYTFSRVALLRDGETAWELTRDMLPWEDGDPFIDPRVAFDDAGNVLVSGTYTHEFGFASAARVWVVKLDPDGQMLCYAQIGEGNNGAVVPRNGFFGTGRAAIDLDTFGPGGMGPGSGDNWLVGLRE